MAVLVLVIWLTQFRPRLTSSPYTVSPSKFPTAKGADILGFLPPPLKPKLFGMRVPNAVHYVYGLKPVPEGESVPNLPYYAYLGMRSALVNLKPEKIYLCVSSSPFSSGACLPAHAVQPWLPSSPSPAVHTGTCPVPALSSPHTPADHSHYQNEPTGPWWDLIKPHLTLIKTNVPESIYGREVSHFAHKADLVRLWVLERMGGIYLDIDMYV